MNKIGLLGGTFNPPHLGHLWIAEECRQRFGLREVWWIPAAIPPHKSARGLVDGRHRVAMLRRLLRGHKHFRILTLELQRPGKSYTFDTVEALHKKHPDCKFIFLLGSDMIDHFGRWHRLDDLQQLLSFIVVARPGWDIKELQRWKKLFSTKAWCQLQTQVADLPGIDISSSDLRRRLKKKLPIHHLCSQAVENYIHQHELYHW